MEHVEVPESQQAYGERPEQRSTVVPFTAAKMGCRLGREDTAELLAEWRERELDSIGGWVQCRGLNAAQLEDVYQETVLGLLDRRHHDREHLRYALRSGIRMRAMNVRRDGLRRGELLVASEPELQLLADARQALEQPEQIVLAEEDRLIAWEFMTELSDAEKRTYELVVEGMGAGRIARARGIPLNEARRLMRACERKREAFQLLYESGRLCGYRAGTIQALLKDEPSTLELADRAFAHLDNCPHCRSEYKTNASRLRRSFRDQVAALLPGPILATHMGWTEKLGVRARMVQHRLSVGDLPFAGPGTRERATVLFAGGGLAGKLAAGTATLALLAGGAIGATRVLEHSRRPHEKTPPVVSAAENRSSAGFLQAVFASLRPVHAARRAPGHVVPIRQSAKRVNVVRKREPGGFAYLGIPANHAVITASRAHDLEQRGGGPFSP